MYIYRDLYICEKLFSKTQSVNLVLALQTLFVCVMVLIVFWKRALHYVYLVHMYTFRHDSFLEFYILATYKVISERIPTCDSAHSWRLYSATPLGVQTARSMT